MDQSTFMMNFIFKASDNRLKSDRNNNKVIQYGIALIQLKILISIIPKTMETKKNSQK